MHVCNVWCRDEEHVDVTYTTQLESSCEMCKEVMERVNKSIKIIHVREVYEFDRKQAKKDFRYCTVSNMPEYDGIETSWELPSDREIRCFRFVFVYKGV